MPVFKRADAEIYFEEFGNGFSVLLLAPGGLGSKIENWHGKPGERFGHYHDWTDVLADRYRVVAMDQRNAGRSIGELSADHGWHTYAKDQLALMDHLDCERFHVIGASIGCSFALKLIETEPARIASAVLQNPIGFTAQHPTVHPDKLSEWAEGLANRQRELAPAAIASLSGNLWRGDFVFSVERDFVKRFNLPVLIMPGDDAPHPASAGKELAETVPGAECLTGWVRPDFAQAQLNSVNDFLEKHTP